MTILIDTIESLNQTVTNVRGELQTALADRDSARDNAKRLQDGYNAVSDALNASQADVRRMSVNFQRTLTERDDLRNQLDAMTTAFRTLSQQVTESLSYTTLRTQNKNLTDTLAHIRDSAIHGLSPEPTVDAQAIAARNQWGHDQYAAIRKMWGEI